MHLTDLKEVLATKSNASPGQSHAQSLKCKVRFKIKSLYNIQNM